MKKVIVPTDFSQASLNALHYATSLFATQEVELTVFHAVEYPVPVGMEYGIVNGDVLSEQIESAVKQAEHKLDTIVRSLPNQPNITYKQMTEVGSLASWVQNYLPEIKPDILVMGTTGASGLKGVFVGSNAEKAVRFATCPVLSVPKEAKWEPIIDIVVPFESDELSDEFLSALKAIQQDLDAGLQMLWVKTPHSLVNEEDLIDEMVNSMKRHGFDRFKVNTRRSFSPTQGVLTFTGEVNGDLIAMATHGHKGLMHLFFDSVTEDVVNKSVIPVWSFNNAAVQRSKVDHTAKKRATVKKS